MQVRELFYKDIERDIKGVIKIGQDDEAYIHQELDEYVVTKELSKHFSDFFDSYNKSIDNYTDKMGVWISGFFGSGKSHFLKILSYLLENREVQTNKAVSYFEDKIQDKIVLGNIKRAGKVSADIILFNIDSKSDSNAKSNKDAIVKVFMKVFNEMQGYCATIPWVADLERQLVKDSNYESFQIEFEELSGSEWIDAREDFYFEEDNIVKALSVTTNMSEEGARNWYTKAEDNYTLSIEKFATLVKEYIESKGSDHHVVFLVDEMGQYIGDDVGLMLNLQTVVEDLSTYCGGKAWVIVTSQQDIDSITRVKGNDFSKIQGRFNTRLNLSSSNVDEVIKKRILRKKSEYEEKLSSLYREKESILRNIFIFSQGTAEMKTYKSEKDFIDVYPFVPYQFNLLQSVFTGIRIHGSSGKHLSEGERSLLSAFQESTIAYKNKEIGSLVPFSAFYETVEAFLDSNIRTVILKAEDNNRLSNEDVEVLKLLFLIKYVKEMPSTIENITTLMVNHVDDDKIDRMKRIEGSLKRLIGETLTQKNGNEYVFLTNEEQDINKEIKNIDIDMGDVILKVGEVIFDEIYQENRYRYNARYNFDFNKMIDSRYLSNPKHEIGLKVITPYYDTGEELSDQALRMMSARENNLIVKLPMDMTFLEETEEVLRIHTYLLRKGGAKDSEEIEAIINRKSRDMEDGKKRVTGLLEDAISEADIYVGMEKLDIKSRKPKERINDGFKYLIDNKYNKVNYINEFVTSNKDLNDILISYDQISIKEGGPNYLAVDEINGFTERNSERNIPMTIKSIITTYGKAPYGWKDLDIMSIILRLFKEQEIKLQMGNEYLTISDKDLINNMTKRDTQDRIVIKKREQISPVYINNVKNLAKELFGISALPSDEDGLMNRFKKYCDIELTKRNPDTKDYGIHILLERYDYDKRYPGKEVLDKGKKLFEEILYTREPAEFYEKVYELKNELLDYEYKVYDIKQFFKNQKTEFDNAVQKLEIYKKNKTYVVDSNTISVVNEIEEIINADEPYSNIQRLGGLIRQFTDQFGKLLEKECKPIRKVIERDRKQVLDELSCHEFEDELRGRLQGGFDDLLERLDKANDFYEAITMREESDRIKIRSFKEIQEEIEARKLGGDDSGDNGNGDGDDGTEITTETVSLHSILRGAKVLETKDDIDEFVEGIRELLKDKLDENTKIKLV